MSLHALKKKIESYTDSSLMPTIFLGHGSPMYAIDDNPFAPNWFLLGENLPKPNAILCISAHWVTKGTFATAMENPPTIHDFYGFPEELQNVQYPAKGSPNLAEETKKIITKTNVELDHGWGLDHGAWSVIRNMYPDANIPVIQLSLDYTKEPQFHFDLAKELNELRTKGVLIIGSGNMVHNLRIMNWHMPFSGFEWAEEARELMKDLIISRDYSRLIHYENEGEAMRLAIPTNEHYLPLLYILGLQGDSEEITFFNDRSVTGSVAMTSILIS